MSCAWEIMVTYPIKMQVMVPVIPPGAFPDGLPFMHGQPLPSWGPGPVNCPVLPGFYEAPDIYPGAGNLPGVITMTETMEEKRKKIARKALEQAEDTGDRQAVNAQRKANKELTGYEGDE